MAGKRTKSVWLVGLAAAVALSGAAMLLARAFVGSARPACETADIRRVAIGRADAVREIRKAHRYTQGLIVSQGTIYESAGYWGHSGLYAVNRINGRSAQLAKIDDRLFAEGLARLGDRLYQLTWQAGVAFVYDIRESGGPELSAPQRFHYIGEGWGLTNTDTQLILSDGSSTLKFISPHDFAVERELAIVFGEEPIGRLNELEMVDGLVLANVYGADHIVAVDPISGCVEAVIDAGRLVSDMRDVLSGVRDPVCGSRCDALDFVLNGIAYDPETAELYLTGKNWPLILVFQHPVMQQE